MLKPFGFFGATAVAPLANTYSMMFDGADAYVDCQAGLNANFDLTDSFSFSAWVKFEGTGERTIISNWKATPNLLGFEFRITSSDKARLILAQTNAIWIYQDSSVLSTGTWYHIGATYDGSNTTGGLNVYVNGILDNGTSGSSSTITTLTTTESVKIGKYVSGNFFDGNLDEVSVWSSVLSAADVATLAGGIYDLKTVLSVTPVAWYRMGDSGTFYPSGASGNWQIPDQMSITNFSNYSFAFDGASYVDIEEQTIFDGLEVVTFSMWLNQASLDTYDVILSKGDASPNKYFWIYTWTTGSGTLYFGIDDDTNVGDGQVTNYSSLVNAGEWFHLAVVYNGAGATDADKIKIFINGTDTSCSHWGTIPTTLPTTVSKTLRIGGSSWGALNGDNGNIDGVAIYPNLELSAPEITAIYNTGTPTDLSTFSKRSFEFDGVDDKITVSTGYPSWPYLSGASACTISFWIKAGISIASTRVLEKTTQFGVFQQGTTNTLTYYIQTSSAIYITGGATLDNTWNHCALIYDGTDMKVYENGSLITTSAQTGDINASAVSLQFGSYGGASHWLTGNLDDVAIFDTAKVIGDLWDGSGKPTDLSAESGLIGYWVFDDALWDGATTEFSVPDLSTNSVAGTTDAMDLETLVYAAPLSPVAFYRMGENAVFNDNTEWEIPNYQKESYWSNLSMDFDGIGDYVSPGNMSVLWGIGAFTISVWVKLAGALTNPERIAGNYLSTNAWIQLAVDTGTDTIGFVMANGSLSYGVTGALSLATDTWYHMVAVFDGSGAADADRCKIYFNGVNQTLAFPGSAIPATTYDHTASPVPFYIGQSGYTSSDQFFEGNLADVSIFTTALTQSQVNTVFNSGVPTDISAMAGLVAYYRMGESANWDVQTDEWEVPNYKYINNYSKYSFDFDGIDQYVGLGNDSALYPGTGDMSYSMWFKADAVSGYQSLISPTTSTTSAKGVSINLFGDEIRVFMGVDEPGEWGVNTGGATGGVGLLTSGVNIAIGTWYHLAVTLDRDGDGVIYIDGSAVLTAAMNPNDYSATDITAAYNIDIGKCIGYFDGLIDSVSIWDKNLLAEEVDAIYNDGVPKDESATSNLVGYWRMGEGATWHPFPISNWTILDDSENSNAGTTAGTAAMDRINNAPGNDSSGLSNSMDEEDVVNNAPSNTEQGVSVSMDVEDRETTAPNNTNQANSVNMRETQPPDGRSTDVPT